MMRRRYLAGIFVKEHRTETRKGEHVSVRCQLSHAECEQLGNELRFQPAPQFFIHAEMGIAVLVVKLSASTDGLMYPA